MKTSTTATDIADVDYSPETATEDAVKFQESPELANYLKEIRRSNRARIEHERSRQIELARIRDLATFD